MEQLLSDVKILDLTHYIVGPYCTKLLADYGADVIKIEKPGEGDESRRLGPFPGNVPHPEKSGLFFHLNTNKRGITLNLKCNTGKKIVLELVKGVDRVVESFSPRVMPNLGLGYEDLVKIRPDLIMASLSALGGKGLSDGLYKGMRGFGNITGAMAGQYSLTGWPDRVPAWVK